MPEERPYSVLLSLSDKEEVMVMEIPITVRPFLRGLFFGSRRKTIRARLLSPRSRGDRPRRLLAAHHETGVMKMPTASSSPQMIETTDRLEE